MSNTHISEFLFRGRCPVNEPDKVPEFSVTLCRWQESVDGTMKPDYGNGPMTPSKAASLGYPASRLVEGINDAALAEVDRLNTVIADLESEVDRLNALLEAKNSQE